MGLLVGFVGFFFWFKIIVQIMGVYCAEAKA